MAQGSVTVMSSSTEILILVLPTCFSCWSLACSSVGYFHLLITKLARSSFLYSGLRAYVVGNNKVGVGVRRAPETTNGNSMDTTTSRLQYPLAGEQSHAMHDGYAPGEFLVVDSVSVPLELSSCSSVVGLPFQPASR